MNMRLLGARTIKAVVPAMVDTSSLKSHIVSVPQDSLYHHNCKQNRFTRQTDSKNTLKCALDEILPGARLRETPAKL
jgi:L-lactate dehydrogenase (cytochrome)